MLISSFYNLYLPFLAAVSQLASFSNSLHFLTDFCCSGHSVIAFEQVNEYKSFWSKILHCVLYLEFSGVKFKGAWHGIEVKGAGLGQMAWL